MTYAIMLDWLIAAYVQFVIMLMEFEKVLSQGQKCFCSKTTTVLSERNIPKTADVGLLLLYCI